MLEKTVTLYFMDRDKDGNGDINGRIECTIGNWEGAVYKLPKPLSKKDNWYNGCKSTLRERLEQSGIYFLFGKTKTGEKTVYVGQSGDKNSGKGTWTRVNGNHTKDAKDEDIAEGISIDNDWREVVIVIHAKAASFLGGVGLNYLENKFYWIAYEANDAGYYKMLNGNEPNSSKGSIRPGDKSEADDFAEHVKTVMRILGYGDLFKASDDGVDKGNKNIFYMIDKGHRARVEKTANGYVLLKGSWISPEVNNLPGNILEAREKYKDKINAKNVLTSDIGDPDEFDKPSTAAGFVMGRRCDGRALWKNSDGISLKKLEKGEPQDDE